MGQQEPAPHCNTTYQTHKENSEWSGGNRFGFLTANIISFGSDLLMSCAKVSANCGPNKEDSDWSGGNRFGFLTGPNIGIV
jgi:hypothetical protein